MVRREILFPISLMTIILMRFVFISCLFSLSLSLYTPPPLSHFHTRIVFTNHMIISLLFSQIQCDRLGITDDEKRARAKTHNTNQYRNRQIERETRSFENWFLVYNTYFKLHNCVLPSHICIECQTIFDFVFESNYAISINGRVWTSALTKKKNKNTKSR